MSSQPTPSTLSHDDLVALARDADVAELARIVRDRDPAALRRELRGDARDLVLEEVFRRFPEYVDGDRIAALEGVVLGFRIVDEGAAGSHHHVRFDRGSCQAGPAVAGVDPRVALQLGAAELLLLATGNGRPAEWLLRGLLDVSGDAPFALELAGFFRVPAADGEPTARLNPLDFDVGAISRVIGEADPKQLQRRLRGPIRELVVDQALAKFPEFFKPHRADGVDATIGWAITGPDDEPTLRRAIRIADGACTPLHEGAEDPTALIRLDTVEFLKLITGNSQPALAFVRRKLKISGDLPAAARLLTMFVIPSPNG
ncbi:Sterol-binding protein [Patulibacter medicamentivorans]|uniref:Sterol-binding protein n=1 Tax=Patulibacter medicamentivorans TaxID=1097667 RepID=H0E9P5_9ACTN|nr:SCP2 sterol-binding domain-containing protein [Patulibacter medicamentivorans]EHN09589.1 Sterol-binding protein [Patulibacter medicamentivorans]